jgi:cobalamin biosynthesis protein CbiG
MRPDPAWRYFGTREVREARAWAAEGGVAVHENLYPSRGRRTAHLLARTERDLLEAAVRLGCEPYWIQRTRTVHFDLVETHLERALRRCGVDPEAPPARHALNGAGARPA